MIGFRKAIAMMALGALVLAPIADAQMPPLGGQQGGRPTQLKTRLDHFSGTQWVLVVSYLPAEITSITCESWTMLGINSWKHHNDFTIPAGPAVAVMDADKFDGYCKTQGSIIAHTDDGDFVGTLDRGPGNWHDSTKLTFSGQQR